MSGGARGKALAIQLIKDKKVLMVSKVSFKAWRMAELLLCLFIIIQILQLVRFIVWSIPEIWLFQYMKEYALDQSRISVSDLS